MKKNDTCPQVSLMLFLFLNSSSVNQTGPAAGISSTARIPRRRSALICPGAEDSPAIPKLMQLPENEPAARVTFPRFPIDMEIKGHNLKALSTAFTHAGGEQAVETKSNKSALMTSPSGFAFDLCQHIKEDK